MPSPKKSLGQHFLQCQWVVDAIIRAGEITKQDTVLEIGSGTGVLTRALARYASRVLAIEKDEKLAAALRKSLEKEGIANVEIIEGDILKVFPDLVLSYQLPATNYKLVANIPYYLTAHLLRIIFDAPFKPSLITLTIQKEVAERIAAKPPHMSMLAVSVQVHGKPEIVKHVPASCFYPIPKVDSSIIKISHISNDFFLAYSILEKRFFEIVRLGFSAKRKQLIGNLAKEFPKTELAAIFIQLNLNSRARAEELTLETWGKLVENLTEFMKLHPKRYSTTDP